MNKIRKVIFVDKSGVSRAPMAAGLLESIYQKKNLEIAVRGIVVQFSEPMNPKVEAVLRGNDITMDGYTSTQLDEKDIDDYTLIFTMEEKQRDLIISNFQSATESNTFLLSTYVGEELEIIDPYGGSIQAYGLCFESMKSVIQKLKEKIEGEN